MSTQGLTAKGVPPQPKWLLFIKFAILGLSLVILALAAYSLSVINSATGGYYYYSGGAAGLLIFVTIKTFIIFGGVTAIEMMAPHMFYRIIALVAYIFSLIFWLSAWAWAASSASAWLALGDYDYYADNIYKREGGALAGCAALGAVVWILSIVQFVFFIKACMADPPVGNQAELGKVNQAPQQQMYAPQPAAYAQQPAYQQPAVYPQQQAYATQ